MKVELLLNSSNLKLPTFAISYFELSQMLNAPFRLGPVENSFFSKCLFSSYPFFNCLFSSCLLVICLFSNCHFLNVVSPTHTHILLTLLL